MTNASAYIVLTTVNVPDLLKGYAKNFLKYRHTNVGFIVIGDLSTPHQKAQQIVQEVKDQGLDAEYCDIASQKKWLRRYPQIAKIIPYRTDNRRNIGFLMAAEKGAQSIITIDDDNYVTEEDFFKYHSIVGQKITLPMVTSTNGWFNNCTMLETNHGGLIYPRGYPFFKRRKEQYSFTELPGSNSIKHWFMDN